MTYFTTGAQLQAALNALPNTKTGNFVAFDSFFYGQQYMGDYQGTLSPIEHFVQIGAARGYKPNATFDPVYYANAFADLKGKGFDSADLLYHFMQYGLDEGRVPNAALASFDGKAYLAAYPDVAAYVNANLAQFGGSATNGALAHYVKFGAAEGRTAPGTSVSNGQTFTLTNSIDNIVGTAGNDTILAGDQNGVATLSAGDQINAGAGIDTLKIYAGLANFASATIKGVEIVEDYTGATTIDVSANADIKEVWLNKASTNAATAAKTQVVGFGDAAGGAAAVATFTAVGGTADAATIAVKDAGKTTAYTSITVAGIEALTVNATGSNKLGNLVAAAAETITFTGAGSVTATLVPGTTVLKSVDASANTGGVNLTLTDAQFGTNPIKVTGGAGNDKIAFTDALGAKATIDLGAGNNTLEIVQGATALTTGSTFVAGAGTNDTLVLNTTTTAIDATSGKMFTGFENIVLKGASSYTVGHIAGITGFEIASGAATSATLDKLASATSVKISASSTGTQTLTLADNSDATSAVNVSLDNSAAVTAAGGVAQAGISTLIDTNAHVLNFASNGTVATGSVNKIDLTGMANSLAQLTNIKIAGSQAAELTTAAASALTLIDGSAATGALTITATGATKSMTIKGGDGKDTIVASDAAGVVSTITGGKGADKITLGGTATNNKGDVVKLTGQADSTAAGFDSITNFAGGTTVAANADKLDLSAFGFTGAQAGIFTLAAGKATVTGTGTAAVNFTITDAQAKDFFANAGADLGVALYTNANETFVFIDADKNGDWNAATDSVVLLVGNYSVDLLTAGQFTFA
ncbi:hypothetical protein [Diaphorobacter sp. MNS-0]|uniref:beta strand repeat-containing protein n=1 Tax=Diaphorobacter sp. MNS-0 TaxID=2866628 RepID=UPI001C735340|nr:hypothetical protein [Diaphorobacter sp. MNS-0]QYY26171.1 hypothetical protein K2L43_03000 [Diaphorobacter sp. MNS-0]